MKLRLVTATRGESPFWSETIASIAALAPGAEHVIVCPAAAMAAVSAQAPKARVVMETGTGLYAALNGGLGVPGDWDAFTWVNDDDRLAPGFEPAWRNLQREPGIGVVYGRVGLIDGQGKSIGWLPVARSAGDLAPLLARGIMPLAQPGTIVRRQVVEAIGTMDESYQLAGDLDFFARALAAGRRFSYCHEIVAQFRLRAGQLSKQEALGDAEFDRAVSRLRSAKTAGGTLALVRFRWANRGVYWDRWRRHGGVTMRMLYRRG